jgi:hypothetical protein
MEQQQFFFEKEAFERREKLLAMPLKDLPTGELREYGGLALRLADWAARLDNPDWQVLLTLKTEGVYTILPDVAQMRTLARALKLRFRSEVAAGRFDDAVRTAKTMFAMARHLGEHPTVIANLVGMAIANMAFGPLEEMLEQPGCPNLYWALTSLPDPLVSLATGIDGERMGIRAEFRDLDETAAMSAERLNQFLAGKDQLLELAGPTAGKPGVRDWLAARTKDAAAVGNARRRLIEFGLAEEGLKRLPADQVILLAEKKELEARLDDIMKTNNLPLWQVEALAAQNVLEKTPALFADAFMPPFQAAVRARWMLVQRIGLLRHIEALRLYAAEHNQTLPAKLSDITVPLPHDPFTGKPFPYEVARNTANLRGDPPSGEEKNPRFNIHYQVILRK